MRVTKQRGASLVQYSILIALLCLGVVPVFWMNGQVIKTQLNNFLDAMKLSYEASTSGRDGSTGVEPGSDPVVDPVPSPDNPISSCTDGICNIDYGSFVFTGLPENLSEFVETSGTAGGTDVVLSIIDKMIEMAENGQLDVDLPLLQQLANKGHSVADCVQNVENFLNDSMTTGALLDQGQLEEVAMIDGHEFAAFHDAFLAFNNSSTPMDPQAKALVEDLYWNVSKMFNTFDDNYTVVWDYQNAHGAISPEAYEAVLHPNTSGLTNLHSAVICNVGNYQDTGHICH